MRNVVTAILASVGTAIYWWITFFTVYANVLFSGDRAPDAQPPTDHDQTLWAASVILIALVLYAVLVWCLLRFTRGRAR